MNKFDTIYQNLIKDILKDGIEEENKRTGHKTRAIPGLTFSIDIEKDGFPLLTLRKIPLKMFIAEQIWFISGERKPEEFLREYTKIWDEFTNPGDVVTVAYGYRWRKHFGRDQLGLLVNLLEKDPSSRHGVVVTWDPGSDGLGGVSKKNVPCPYTFTVNIIGGKLNLHNVVRSNDMLLGMPADVAGFALLQCILAKKLKVKPGVYTHTISNAHIYDIHYGVAKEIISRNNNHEPISLNLPDAVYERAEKKDKALVEEIYNDILNQYHPMDAIKGIKIVL
ncbi:MAG: thymidylate synthase [Candidatus Paceibacterota bacterium]